MLHVFSCLLNPFSYSLRYLISFSQSIANFPFTIANYYYSAKTKASSTFNNLCNTVDKYYLLDELFLNPFFRSLKFSQETPPLIIFNQ